MTWIETIDTADDRRVAIISGVILLMNYTFTSAPGLGWFDSAEWAMVIESWGLGHPPGSPGYILLAGGLAHLLPVPFDRALVLVSAIFAALTVFPLDRILKCLGCRSGLMRLGWLVMGGLLPNLWLQAVRIELYSLSTFLFFIVVERCIGRREGSWGDRRTALILGFLLTVNPLFGILGGFIFAITLFMDERQAGIKSLITRAVTCAAMLTLGLIPYAYCFVIGGLTDRFVWGSWDSFEGVLFYFSGQDYAVNWAGEPTRLQNVWAFVRYWFDEGSLLVLFAGVALAFRSVSRNVPWRSTIFAAALLGYFVVSNRLFYPEVPDYHGYLAPIYWVGVIGLAIGIRTLRLSHQGKIFGLVALVANFSPHRSIEDRDLSAQVLPTQLVSDMLMSVPNQSILMLTSDHLVFPLMYLQSKGARPDIIIFNEGFANSSWYWQFLKSHHQNLVVDGLLRPMSRDERIRRFLVMNQARPILFESPASANRLRMMTCPAGLFARAAQQCDEAPLGQQLEQLDRYWSLTATHLLLSQKVIAKLAEDAAIIRLQRGQFTEALAVLRAGITPDDRPEPCVSLSTNMRPKPPKLSSTLIGSSARNFEHFQALCQQLSATVR